MRVYKMSRFIGYVILPGYAKGIYCHNGEIGKLIMSVNEAKRLYAEHCKGGK